jgi:hypothetical protein
MIRAEGAGRFMNTKAVALLVSSILAPAIYAHGQIDCTTSTKLVCELPTSSAVLAASVVSQKSQTSAAQAAAIASAQTVSRAVNSSIGTQLTQIPIPSGSVGVVSLQQKDNPLGVPYENLGPILTGRPDTVGRHRLFAGFSYQHFNFNSIDGISLKSLPVGFQFSQSVQVGNQPTDTQAISSSELNKVGFQLDQYVGLITYGLTSTTDVSIALPFNDVSLSAVSSNFKAYIYDQNSNQYQNASLPAGTTIPSSGTANGIGDVIVNIKQLLIGKEGLRPAVAAGLDIRFPTGDALNYLGSGAYGYNLHGLFEYRWKVSPHLKLGYQWNGRSELVTSTSNSAKSTTLPGGLQYDAGADYSVIRQVTIAVDVLGSQFVNSPSLSISALPLSPAPPASFTSLPTVVPVTTTYTTSNISGGVKYHASRHWTLYGNVLVPLNNAGLRSNLVPLGGISYNR